MPERRQRQTTPRPNGRRLTDLLADHGLPFRTGEAAALLGYSSQRIRDEIAAGEIQAYRTSADGDWRITFEALKAYALRIGALRDCVS